MENKSYRIIKKWILLPLFMLMVYIQPGFGQNRGFEIPANKLLIDANDPAWKQVKPGDTLYFQAGKRMYLNIKNFMGLPGSPIVMINKGGEVIIDTDHYYGISIQNCRYIKLTGTGYPGQFYGFKIKRVAKGAGLGIGNLSSDFEIDHVSIENTLIGGLYAKTDPDCTPGSDRSSFTQYNTVIHDNYIAFTGDEGMYIGSTKYDGQIVRCNGKDTLLMPGILDGVRIYNNIVKYSGWDGIQVSSASRNCSIFNNTVLHDSQKHKDNQMSGIIIGGGTKCDCYNNFISQGNGVGIECHGLGGTRIFNNIIVDAGKSYLPGDKTKMKHGIYVSDVSVQRDSSFYIMHNNIINPKSDGIRFSSLKSKGNYIVANLIINPGNYDYYERGNNRTRGIGSYIMFPNGETGTTLKNNYLARDAGAAGFLSKALLEAEDFRLINGSGLIDAVDVYAKAKVTFDFLNIPRPFGRKPDIGAFEYNGTVTESTIQTKTKNNK